MSNPKSFGTVYAGDQTSITRTARDADGNAVNISGYIINWAIATDETASGVVVVSKSYPASGVSLVDDGVNGVFTVAISGVDTASLDGTYYEEAARITTGVDETVLVGTLRIRPTII